MNQGADLFKSIAENYEALKSYMRPQAQAQLKQLQEEFEYENYEERASQSPQPEQFNFRFEDDPKNYEELLQEQQQSQSQTSSNQQSFSHRQSSHPQQQQQQLTSRGVGGNHIAGTKVFVNNIGPEVQSDDISSLFGSYGQINDIKVFNLPDQNYAYIIFDRYEDAFSACNEVPPNPSWAVSLAKSKNTIHQYQQSTMFNQLNPEGAFPRRPNQKRFYGSANVKLPRNFEPSFQSFQGGESGTKTFHFNKQSYGQNQDGGEQVYTSGRNFGGYQQKSGSQGSQQFNRNTSEGRSNNSGNQFGIIGNTSFKGTGYLGRGIQDDQNFPSESHLKNILNNEDSSQLIDLMMMPTERVQSLMSNKTQINQTILVREIWISNLDEKCETIIRDIFEDNFGPVEAIEFFRRGKQSFAFVKFFMVQTACYAFTDKEKVSELLEATSLKLTYSDPSRRKNIIGDHKDYMKDESLSPVLYISFPFGFKISKQVIVRIANEYGTVLNVTVKRSEDAKQTSSVLVEFKDIKDAKFAYQNLPEDKERMNPSCEFAILLNSDKFVKENNLKLKDKSKDSLNPKVHRPFVVPIIEPPPRPVRNRQQQQQQQLSDDLNIKRTFEKYVKPIPEEQEVEQEEEEEEEDSENFFWSGFILMKSKGKCGMDAKIVKMQGSIEFESSTLVVNSKSTVAEALKNDSYSLILLRPANSANHKTFQEIKAFINQTPTEAAVINAKNFIVYLLPSCEEANQLYPSLPQNNILAICRTTEATTKKEIKVIDKNIVKEKQYNQFNPASKTSYPSPPSKSTSAKLLYENEEEEEEIYDPNQASLQNHPENQLSASKNQNSASKIQNSASKNQNSASKIQLSASKNNQFSASKNQNSASKLQYSDSKIQYSDSKMQFSDSKMQYSDNKNQNSASKNQNSASKNNNNINNPDLSDLIANPKLMDSMLKSLSSIIQ